jgi:2'-hydroxyisoflavone reductase
MDILIIGGSNFVGYHIAEAALNRGHKVTLLNRGKSNPGAFPTAEKLIGDRDSDLAVLEGRRWDAVIDTCGYVPRIVRKSAEALKDSGYYLFISTISVYPASEYGRPFLDEESPTAVLSDPATETVNGDTYGGLKVLCENVVNEIYGPRACIVRPGLIVGPRDFTDRFMYWPRRVAKGGEILAPGTPDLPFQVIDGRDLAHFTITLAENKTSGVYNAVGPGETTSWEQMFAACIDAAGNKAPLTWVDEAFLLGNQVAPFTDLPLWLPKDLGAISRVRFERAQKAGLKHRPLIETVRDMLAWDATRRAEQGDKFDLSKSPGISPEREAELLAQWKAASGA